MATRSDRFHGILAVDKPSGMSSHDVVQRVRRTVNQRSVGHTGTLDPLAALILAPSMFNVTNGVILHLVIQLVLLQTRIHSCRSRIFGIGPN